MTACSGNAPVVLVRAFGRVLGVVRGAEARRAAGLAREKSAHRDDLGELRAASAAVRAGSARSAHLRHRVGPLFYERFDV
jgi:hypothetical protein